MTRVAVFGAGYWSSFQIAGWQELPGVDVVAIYNRTRAKAEALARRFGVPSVYDNPEELLDQARPDVVDVITDVDTHSYFVRLAAARGIPVICQKPMAPSLAAAESLVRDCAEAGVPFLVHENWRWQTPIRALKRELVSRVIGAPFRARIQYANSFPVFDNQPFLRELEQFILTDIGTHILDTGRFLFGDAQQLYCTTRRVHAEIRGEDVATVMLQHGNLTCTCEMSYASTLEHERFPETYILVEGQRGSLELGPDYWIRRTTDDGTVARRYQPRHYPWADPPYDLIHESIVPCLANLLRSIQSGTPAETPGEDNLQTLRLVFGAYESARTGQVVSLI